MSESTKAKIIGASIRLFTQNGYKKTTTKLIAKEAGVNEVTIFRQFQNKEGIVKEIVISKLPYLRSIQTYLKTKSVFDVETDLIEVGRLYYEGISKNIEMLMVLYYEMGPAFQQAFSIIPNELKETLINYFIKMQQDKKIIDMDPEILALSFTSSNIGFALINEFLKEGFVHFSSKEYIEQNIKIFAKGIRL